MNKQRKQAARPNFNFKIYQNVASQTTFSAALGVLFGLVT
jgi:hypothetical protein